MRHERFLFSLATLLATSFGIVISQLLHAHVKDIYMRVYIIYIYIHAHIYM